MANVYKGDKVVNTGVWYTDNGASNAGQTTTFPFAGPDGTGVARAATDLDKAKGYVAHPKAQFLTDQVGITDATALGKL